MRLRRRKRPELATLSVETPMRSGAIVARVSYEVWDALSLRDRDVLLRVDDCMAGRYDVAELRRRLYPTENALPAVCKGCENEDAGGAFVTGVAVSHNFGPGCRRDPPWEVASS